ncbi:U1 snRNP protein [Sporothrix bragantina]|uniref:U1 snRNP protein n=1 Tax=Sporothrix bragantina TaxID=671064 RepID=A0ABP0BZL6_9PEZI
MAPPNLVLLNRRFDDDQHQGGETPTAHGFPDYDEGDILDELLQETLRTAAAPSRIATVTALSTETLQSRNASLPRSSPPSPSTCSSTTAAEDEFDRENNDHDDTASVTSNTGMSVSSRSVSMRSGNSSCIAPSSTASPKMPPAAVATGGRRRRRRNHRGVGVGVAASDAGSESISRHERVQDKGPQSKSRGAVTARPQEKAPPVKEETANNKQTTKKSKKTKSTAVSEARRSRHPRLQIGLDLDVELQLKSKVRGDICLTLVLEETQKVVPRTSPEIRRNADGHYVAYDDWEDIEAEDAGNKKRQAKDANKSHGADSDIEEIEVTRVVRSKKGQTGHSVEPRPGVPGIERRELCHLRVGRLNLTRRWWMDGYEMISRIPPPIVAGVAMTMPVAGFAAGYAAAQWAGMW